MTQNTSNIENLKQELDSLGIKYRSNATESNLKHLLSKHKAQQPKEVKVSQNELQSDSVTSYVKNDLEGYEEIKLLHRDDSVEDLKSEELGQETQAQPSGEEAGLQAEKLQLSSTFGEFGDEKVSNPSESEVSDAIAHIQEAFKQYRPEDVVVAFSTTDENGEPVTIEGFSEESEITLDKPIHLHTDKPTFGYKKPDFTEEKIVIKTNVLKNFFDQIVEAAQNGYELSSEPNAVNTLDTPYRVKLVKGEPVADVQTMKPEVKIKIKVYKQSEFIKELLRITKLGGKLVSYGGITMLSGLYTFEVFVDSNYELRKNIDFYAGKV